MSILRAGEAVDSVLKESPKANIKIVALDLGSGESIRAAAAEILALDLPINVSPPLKGVILQSPC